VLCSVVCSAVYFLLHTSHASYPVGRSKRPLCILLSSSLSTGSPHLEAAHDLTGYVVKLTSMRLLDVDHVRRTCARQNAKRMGS